MRSQVSFRFDGEHNKNAIVNILKQNLKGIKYSFEKEGYNLFRIYVASEEPEQKTFNVCYGIQCYSMRDYNREL